MGSQLDLISVLWYVEWLHLHYPPSLKICEFFTLQTWKNISAVILCHTTMATWLVTGFAHVCSWCFSDCVPSVSGNGACRHGWECWEERKQPGWHVDWSIANHCQTGRNPCQLCLPPPVRLSESVAVMLADIQSLLPAVKIYSFVSITLSVTASVVNMTQ